MSDYTQEDIDENRRKWLAVLRDPKSSKNRGSLESYWDENSRCCLGHACHALDVEKEESKPDSAVYYDGKDSILPKGARNALDIDHRGNFIEPVTIISVHPNSLTHRYEDYFTAYDLIDVNDNTNLTPKEIADVIEEQFENDNFHFPE